MFLLNSCLSLFSAAACAAPLLPKLRGHFAEFLDNASPAGLRILSSSTCVGLRYGYDMNNSGFSRRPACALRYSFSLRITPPGCAAVFPSAPLLRLPGSFLSPAALPFRVPTVLSYHSTGISTCCPSATLLSLALGPDLPRADQLYPGILGYSAKRIPTSFSLLIPAFSLHISPLLLPVQLLRYVNAPLPMHLNAFLSFGVVFQPRTFSAQDLSTSELLRTLSMCGCF